MNPDKTGKIIGPPGCGKTTEVMRLVTAACDRYFPDKIGAISFTRAAVGEIKSRIEKTVNVSGVGKNVRTIHSHCYHLLGMSKDRIAETDKRKKEFNESNSRYSLPLQGGRSNPEDDSGGYFVEKNSEAVYTQMMISRNRMIPRKEWDDDLCHFYDTWTGWMAENSYMDFTSMLEIVLVERLCPDIEILFIDEAQDLTPLQYEVTRMWAERTSYTLYVGDENQCIFRFQGAIPEAFKDLKHDWNKILDQSYRVSPAIHKYAQTVIERADNREVVKFKPTDKYGKGEVIQCMKPDLSLDGTHMIICRCNYMLKRWTNYLLEQNTMWHNPYRLSDKGWNPATTNIFSAVKTWLDLMDGKEVKAKPFQDMTKQIIAKGNLKHGAKTRISKMDTTNSMDLFDLPGMGFDDAFINNRKHVSEVFSIKGLAGKMLENDPKIVYETPRVIIGTVHSVKGGEADHVWLDTAVSPLIFQMMRDPEHRKDYYDEARVAYVGATRARKTLGLLVSRLRNPVLV